MGFRHLCPKCPYYYPIYLAANNVAFINRRYKWLTHNSTLNSWNEEKRHNQPYLFEMQSRKRADTVLCDLSASLEDTRAGDCNAFRNSVYNVHCKHVVFFFCFVFCIQKCWSHNLMFLIAWQGDKGMSYRIESEINKLIFQISMALRIFSRTSGTVFPLNISSELLPMRPSMKYSFEQIL